MIRQIERGRICKKMKAFIAYYRKLLRVVKKIEKHLENGESEKALELMKGL